jgi:hypothetical protein
MNGAEVHYQIDMVRRETAYTLREHALAAVAAYRCRAAVNALGSLLLSVALVNTGALLETI